MCIRDRVCGLNEILDARLQNEMQMEWEDSLILPVTVDGGKSLICKCVGEIKID